MLTQLETVEKKLCEIPSPHDEARKIREALEHPEFCSENDGTAPWQLKERLQRLEALVKDPAWKIPIKLGPRDVVLPHGLPSFLLRQGQSVVLYESVTTSPYRGNYVYKIKLDGKQFLEERQGQTTRLKEWADWRYGSDTEAHMHTIRAYISRFGGLQIVIRTLPLSEPLVGIIEEYLWDWVTIQCIAQAYHGGN